MSMQVFERRASLSRASPERGTVLPQVLFGTSWDRITGLDDLGDSDPEDVAVLSVLVAFPLACMMLVVLLVLRSRPPIQESGTPPPPPPERNVDEVTLSAFPGQPTPYNRAV